MTQLTYREIENELTRRRGWQESAQKTVTTTETSIKTLQDSVTNIEEARSIIQSVAQATQKELEYHISEIVTLALASVFDNPYKLSLEFVTRRGKSEADLMFERDGEKISPLDASGGGVVDIASIALRIALWTIKRPQSRNVLILDEPAKFVSANLRSRVSMLFKELSKRLGIQIIMVSHAQELIESADRSFEVTIHKGVSTVKQIDGVETVKTAAAPRTKTADKGEIIMTVEHDEETPEKDEQKLVVPEEMRSLYNALLEGRFPAINKALGASGKFTDETMNQSDANVQKLAIGNNEEKVIMEFGKAITFIAFAPDEAVQIAQILLNHARICAEKIEERRR